MSKLREGYKQTKVGVIPEEWEVVRLGDIVDIKSGYAFKSKNFIEFASKYQVIKMSNIYQNKLLLNRTPSFLNNVTSKELEFLLNKGDIVITLTGTMGKRDYGYSVQINNEKNLLLNQRLARLREINNKCNISFIGYQLKNDRFLFQFFESTRGGTGNQANVGIKDLSLFKIPLPPLKEQQKIAQILSTWESAISKQEALIKAKEQLKKGLMQKLLSGEVRFKEFGAGTLVPSNKLGVEVSTSLNNHHNNGTKVPAPEWEEVRFREVFERVTRKNTIGNTNVLTISAQYGLINQEDFFNKSVASKDLSNYILLRKGEFAYNKSYSNGYPMGAFKRLNFYDEGVLSSLYIYFAIKNDNSDFYEHYFDAGLMNREIYKIAQEGARNHGLLNMSIVEFFHDMKVIRPPIDEQQKIAQVLTTADKETTLLKEELETLKEQKRGLMQRLLSGDVRVVA